MASAFIVNPRRKRRRHHARRRHKMRRNPAPRKVKRNPARKFRRNPSAPAAAPRRRRRRRSFASARRSVRGFGRKLGLGGIMSMEVMPAVQGAIGAIGVDVALGYIPLPDALKTPTTFPLMKGVIAVAIGMLAAKFGKPSLGRAMAVGGMTVALHDAGKNLVKSALPSLNMGEYLSYYNPALPVMGSPSGGGTLGEYLNGGPLFAGMPSFPSAGFQTNQFGVSGLNSRAPGSGYIPVMRGPMSEDFI